MESKWVYLAEPFEKSCAINVNFLFNEGNIYISDNHLCALWGWLQHCSPRDEYNFIHVDYHKDLGCPKILDYLKSIEQVKTIDDLLKYREIHMEMINQPFLAYDTYIWIAQFIRPMWFSEMTFLTKECSFNNTFEECRLNPLTNCIESDCLWREKKIEYKNSCTLEDVIKNITVNQYKHKVILNLDLDYFFDCQNHIRDAYWSDQRITEFVMTLQEALGSGNIQVLTIAMSPECCNSNGHWSYDIRDSYDIMCKFLPILSGKAQLKFSAYRSNIRLISLY